MSRFFNLLIAVIALSAASPLFADGDAAAGTPWSIERWTLMTSVYTRHFDPEPDHTNHQKLIGLEVDFSNRWLAGFSVFDNSFGQSSQFLYMGKRWDISDSEFWYFSLRGGLLHGYKEPYENKIPLNGLGIAPAIVPAVGFRYRNFMSEVNIAGTAAVMFTVGLTFE